MRKAGAPHKGWKDAARQRHVPSWEPSPIYMHPAEAARAGVKHGDIVDGPMRVVIIQKMPKVES